MTNFTKGHLSCSPGTNSIAQDYIILMFLPTYGPYVEEMRCGHERDTKHKASSAEGQRVLDHVEGELNKHTLTQTHTHTYVHKSIFLFPLFVSISTHMHTHTHTHTLSSACNAFGDEGQWPFRSSIK